MVLEKMVGSGPSRCIHYTSQHFASVELNHAIILFEVGWFGPPIIGTPVEKAHFQNSSPDQCVFQKGPHSDTQIPLPESLLLSQPFDLVKRKLPSTM